MELLPRTVREQLAENGRINQARIAAGEDTIDFEPVVKFFTPDAGATWLLTEMRIEPDQVARPFVEDLVGHPGPEKAFLRKRQQDVANAEREQNVRIKDNHEGVGHKTHALSNS